MLDRGKEIMGIFFYLSCRYYLLTTKLLISITILHCVPNTPMYYQVQDNYIVARPINLLEIAITTTFSIEDLLR